MKSYVRSLETADGTTTPRLICASLGVAGYPFGFDLTCTDAEIVIADTTLLVHGLKATALVYNLTQILAFAQAPVAISDAFTGSSRRLDFADATMSVRLTGWRIGRASLVIDAPVWTDTLLEDRLVGRAERFEAHLIDIPEQHDSARHTAALAGYSKIGGLQAPEQAVNAAEMTLEGEITGLSDDVRTYGDTDMLRQWQQAGGKLALTGFKGNDGDNFFDVSGTLGLDNQARVEGQLKIVSRGLVERLGSLLPDQYRGLILGAEAADGSYSQTVNIRAGLVFTGIVPTALIPPLY